MARGDDIMCHTPGEPTTCEAGVKAGAKGAGACVGAAPPVQVAGRSPVVEIDAFLAEAAATPADCGSPMELPPWFDWDKFRRGQQYFHHNMFALFAGKLSGLLCVLAIPSILRVLCFTRQSGDPCSAFNRYVATLLHMLDWYDGDLLEPTSRVYQSLSQVRAKHAAGAKRARKAGLGLMSQMDMLLTQFGFMGFALVSPDKLGIGADQDVEGFVHFWRTVGFLLGMEDRFNLCRDDLEETKALCRAVQERKFRTSMQDLPQHFETMSRALISGMKCMVPHLDYNTYVRFISEDLLAIENIDTKIPMWSRFLLGLQRFVHRWLLGVPALACLFRPLFNAHLRSSLWFIRNCPFLAYWRFGKAQVIHH